MDGPVVSRSFVTDQARRAVAAGTPLHDACPWPLGTAAGQAFQTEFQAQAVVRGAGSGSGSGLSEVCHD
jgi:hypothetical protein